MSPWMHFSLAVEQFVEQYPSSTERGEQEVCFKMLILCLSELTYKFTISKFQKYIKHSQDSALLSVSR